MLSLKQIGIVGGITQLHILERKYKLKYWKKPHSGEKLSCYGTIA